MGENVNKKLGVRLHRRIHETLVLDVEFELGNQVGVIFGQSGAGKTTLLRLIAGLSKADSGTLTLDGRVLFDSKSKRDLVLRNRGIGMIFQDDLLFPHLSARENLGFGLKGWQKDHASQRISEVAKLCGVDHVLDRRPETLSGGERQRVGLARSLAPRPHLLLCDEPVSALDLVNRNALIDRLKAIQESESLPILYVTHSPAEAISVGDILYLMENGRIVEQGGPIEVLGRCRLKEANNWEGLRNVFKAQIKEHSFEDRASILKIYEGPSLHVPSVDLAVGHAVTVEVHASEIILASSPGIGLSAQNVIPGQVESVVPHGSEAEVVVRTEGVRWIVSLVMPAVRQLGLAAGSDTYLIIKARSFRTSERY